MRHNESRAGQMSKYFPRDRDHAFGLEAKLALQLFERCRSTERMHADDTALPAHVALPAERGGLLDRHTSLVRAPFIMNFMLLVPLDS